MHVAAALEYQTQPRQKSTTGMAALPVSRLLGYDWHVHSIQLLGELELLKRLLRAA